MSTYMMGHSESVLRSHRWRTAANSAAYLLPHLRPGMRVLDVGCGPGTITVDLGRAVGATGSVLGVDSSAEVLAAARAASSEPNVRFAVQDVMSLGHADGAFDVVHAHQVLQHLADPVAALREMRRVTRPGGLVAVREADYAATTWFPPSPELDRWLEIYRAVSHASGTEPDAGRRVLSWSLAAGFPDVSASASLWCFADPQSRRWWGGMHADRIVESRVAERAVELSLADVGELGRISAAWRAWAEVEDGWCVVVHGEVLCHVPATLGT